MVNQIRRTVNDVKNPIWVNSEHTLLDCEVDFDELDEVYVPFTANPNDVEEHGRKIFEDCVAGIYGEIEEFDVAAFEEAVAAKKAADEAAETARQASLDKWKALGLTEQDLENLGLNK